MKKMMIYIPLLILAFCSLLSAGTTYFVPTSTPTALMTGTASQLVGVSTTGSVGGTFGGTSLYQNVNYPGLFEISAGTSGSPVTAAKPLVKISRTENVQLSSLPPGDNADDLEGNTTLEVYVQGSSTSQVNSVAINGVATGNSTGASITYIGLVGQGTATGSSTGGGMGAYLQGMRTTATAQAAALEARVINWTSTNGTYFTNSSGSCDDIWVTSSGDGTHTTVVGSALHVGNGGDPLTTFHSGLTINSNAIDATGFGIDDVSAGVTGIWERGTHTTGISLNGVTTSGFGLDFQGGTFANGKAMRLPNNSAIWTENAAGNADLITMYVDPSNHLLLGADTNFTAVYISTTSVPTIIDGALNVTGNITQSTPSANSGGGLVHKVVEAVSSSLSGASGTITLGIPSGDKITAVQLRVDTAITTDGATTWSAVFTNTPTTAICTGQLLAKSTAFSAFHTSEITTGTVAITLTPASGNFAGGVVRAIVYYDELAAMSAAP